MQNSLFIPDLGGLLNRRPTYNITRRDTAGTVPTGMTRASRPGTAVDAPTDLDEETDSYGETRPRLTHTDTISSTLSESRYAVLPHGQRLADDWTQEEKAELNDLVRHMLHSRRAGVKRGWKGFLQYVKKREYSATDFLDAQLTGKLLSPRPLCYHLRYANYTVWSCLGSLLNWYAYPSYAFLKRGTDRASQAGSVLVTEKVISLI